MPTIFHASSCQKRKKFDRIVCSGDFGGKNHFRLLLVAMQNGTTPMHGDVTITELYLYLPFDAVRPLRGYTFSSTAVYAWTQSLQYCI